MKVVVVMHEGQNRLSEPLFASGRLGKNVVPTVVTARGEGRPSFLRWLLTVEKKKRGLVVVLCRQWGRAERREEERRREVRNSDWPVSEGKELREGSDG